MKFFLAGLIMMVMSFPSFSSSENTGLQAVQMCDEKYLSKRCGDNNTTCTIFNLEYCSHCTLPPFENLVVNDISFSSIKKTSQVLPEDICYLKGNDKTAGVALISTRTIISESNFQFKVLLDDKELSLVTIKIDPANSYGVSEVKVMSSANQEGRLKFCQLAVSHKHSPLPARFHSAVMTVNQYYPADFNRKVVVSCFGEDG